MIYISVGERCILSGVLMERVPTELLGSPRVGFHGGGGLGTT